MLGELKTRAELLANYEGNFVQEEEDKCFFKLGDIIRLEVNGVKFITQINGICTGGYAYAHSSSKQLRTCDDAEVLWRAV